MSFNEKRSYYNLWMINPLTAKLTRFQLNVSVIRSAVYSILVLGMFAVSGLQYYNQNDSTMFVRSTKVDQLQVQLSETTDKYKEIKDQFSRQLSNLALIIESASRLGLLTSVQKQDFAALDSVGGLEIAARTKLTCKGSDCQQSYVEPSSVSALVNPTGRHKSLLETAQGYAELINALPLANPLKDSRITSNFGYRKSPFTKAASLHKGLDLKSYYGAPVLSTAPGRVVFAGFQSGYGRLVTVQHSDKVKTRYAHMSAFKVKKGDAVEVGQTVGLMGNSGRSTGPHLHYEVLVNGRQINPWKLIQLGKLVRTKDIEQIKKIS